MFNKEVIIKQAEHYNSFYLYDQSAVEEHIRLLQNSFNNVTFLYSVKCNPNQYILNTVFASGFGADAASAEEVNKAFLAGLSKDRIYYSAPGKTAGDIAETIDRANIIADSIGEINKLQAAAEKNGITANIGVRINPSFSFWDGIGTASKFGIDEELLFEFLSEASLPNLRINGIHVHLHSQELNADILSTYHKNMFALAERVEAKTGVRLDYINFGSGIGIPFSASDSSMNIEKLSANFNKLSTGFTQTHPDTKLFIETGRFVSCEAGVYVSKVIDKKVSRGRTYIILSNTMNGFLRPTAARMAAHLSPAGDEPDAMWEPLYTGRECFSFIPIRSNADGVEDKNAIEDLCIKNEKTGKTEKTEKVDLVGCLCTGTDVIAEDIVLPELNEGDIIVIPNAGAYAAVLTPMQFASLKKPAELFLDTDGNIRI